MLFTNVDALATRALARICEVRQEFKIDPKLVFLGISNVTGRCALLGAACLRKDFFVCCIAQQSEVHFASTDSSVTGSS